LEEADVVVVLGGDGFMLTVLHQMLERAGGPGLWPQPRHGGLYDEQAQIDQAYRHPRRRASKLAVTRCR
jgi:hypothetical protein